MNQRSSNAEVVGRHPPAPASAAALGLRVHPASSCTQTLTTVQPNTPPSLKICNTLQRYPDVLRGTQACPDRRLTATRRKLISLGGGESLRLRRGRARLYTRQFRFLFKNVTHSIAQLTLTPFERNIEVWRQLWRVVERCDVIVQIVDARDPLLCVECCSCSVKL
jgi:hypothetical protein